MCGVKSYNKCSKCCLSALTRPTNPTIVLPLVYCPVDDKLFEVSPGLRFLGVSRRYCCYVNHAAGHIETTINESKTSNA